MNGRITQGIDEAINGRRLVPSRLNLPGPQILLLHGPVMEPHFPPFPNIGLDGFSPGSRRIS
jgi:hypothetical protein